MLLDGGGGAGLGGFLLLKECEGEGVELLEVDEDVALVLCRSPVPLGLPPAFLTGMGLLLGGGGAGLAGFFPELLGALRVSSLVGEECSEEDSSLLLNVSTNSLSAVAASMALASKSMEDELVRSCRTVACWLSSSPRTFGLTEGEVGVVGMGSERLG